MHLLKQQLQQLHNTNTASEALLAKESKMQAIIQLETQLRRTSSSEGKKKIR